MTLNEIILISAAVVFGFVTLISLFAFLASSSRRVQTDETYQENSNYLNLYGYGNSAFPQNGYYSQNGAYYGGNVNYNSSYRNFYGNTYGCVNYGYGNQVYGNDARFANYYSESY